MTKYKYAMNDFQEHAINPRLSFSRWPNTHCFSHLLICLSKACEVAPIKNMTNIVGAVSTFFSCSAKCTDKLKYFIIIYKYFIDTVLSDECSTTNEKTLWNSLGYQHDSHLSFKELYIYTVATLEDLEYHDSNPETSNNASLYVSATTKVTFLFLLKWL